MTTILLIDDEPKDHVVLSMCLPPLCRLVSCYSAGESMDLIEREKPQIILLDINLPDADGLAFLRNLRSTGCQVPVIMLSCERDPDTVAAAAAAGAVRYLYKPYHPEDLRRRIEETLCFSADSPGDEAGAGESEPLYGNLIAASASMRESLLAARRFAESDGCVLILGESGTGKDVFARIVHELSLRREGPFVVRNCGALPDALLESEIFGSEKGAFTDARSRPGCMELAHRGTLFLDEVAELSPRGQAVLLRVLEEGQVTRLGGLRSRAVDVRVICATNRALRRMVDEGRFREDLYYRLNVLTLRLPPLRERSEDIPRLAVRFLASAPAQGFLPEAMRLLAAHSWPGNVRELKNVVERAASQAGAGWIGPEHLSFD